MPLPKRRAAPHRRKCPPKRPLSCPASSCSLSGLTPVNGTELGEPIELTFTKNAKEEEVSLRITGDKSVYNAGDQAKINVYVKHSGPTEIPDGTALVLRLLSKDVSNNGLTSNVYIDTGWKQESETKVGDGEENANVVPLGQSLTGSCCIVLEMRDAVGNVLKSVPYYFVISGE